jgi:hypothetical protein
VDETPATTRTIGRTVACHRVTPEESFESPSVGVSDD